MDLETPVSSPAQQDVAAFIRAVPKVELHVHLVGTASPRVVSELAVRHPGSGVPQDEVAVAAWFEFTDLDHFVEVYHRVSQLIRSREDLAVLVEGAARSLAAQHVRYAEITVTPFTHFGAGMTAAEVAAGLNEGRAGARAVGVDVAWVYDIPGMRGPAAARATVDAALQEPPEGLVALGLGGAEAGVSRSDFAWAFEEAAAAGLRSVPHAGEGDGPSSIRAALDHLGADRIGHGVRVVEDPELLRRVVDDRVPLEVCPTSNVCTGLYTSLAEHPLPDLVAAGALVTVNSDDPTMFSTTLNDEYLRVADAFDMDVFRIEALVRNGIDAAFLEASRKVDLHAEVDAVRGSPAA